ncbi:MAG: hypothetical protein HC786_29610 [Richelia sp. CSU_2_1]|nr:hypothetical protein [Richelia sp. CSU_2_1]
MQSLLLPTIESRRMPIDCCRLRFRKFKMRSSNSKQLLPKNPIAKTDNAQSLESIAENPAPLNSAAAISENENNGSSAIDSRIDFTAEQHRKMKIMAAVRSLSNRVL